MRNKNGLAITIGEPPPIRRARRQGKPHAFNGANYGWLCAGTLLFTTLLFLFLGVTLLLVWHYDIAQDGFTLVTNNRYSWTYGPTAILVFVVAIWRQID